MQASPLKSNGKVRWGSHDFYVQWRMGASWRAQLHDSAQNFPPERLLQTIWQHQRLKREALQTLDGTAVRILHPGWWNHEAGPDFKDAVIQIDGHPVQVGDIEIDVEPSGWQAHDHAGNPAYENVVLHVVWKAGSANHLPTVSLTDVLDSSLNDLHHWLGQEGVRNLPPDFQGRCVAPLKDLTDVQWRSILAQAALIRLQAKAAHMEARARQVGWEQTLFETLFRALGYKQNVWPMQRLGELAFQLRLPTVTAGMQNPVLYLQAMLFGLSGLLPEDVKDPSQPVDAYVRQLWDIWWQQRGELADFVLPRQVWRFNGIRPSNHPQRRLALAAHWLARQELPAELEDWLTQDIPEDQLAERLLSVMQAKEDEFWSWRWTMKVARMVHPQALLGASRLTDVAMNVILPWLWLRAAAGGNKPLLKRVEERYLSWPRAEDNVVLRQARHRLLGPSGPRVLDTAAEQQGLMQITRDFCEHSNATCEACKFPGLVASLSAKG